MLAELERAITTLAQAPNSACNRALASAMVNRSISSSSCLAILRSQLIGD